MNARSGQAIQSSGRSPFSGRTPIAGALLARLMPRNPDLYLDNVVLAVRRLEALLGWNPPVKFRQVGKVGVVKTDQLPRRLKEAAELLQFLHVQWANERAGIVAQIDFFAHLIAPCP